MKMTNKSLVKSNKVLFDASALLALINKEPGYEILEDMLASSCISSVNLAEVISVLSRIGVTDNEIQEILNVIPEIIPFTTEISITAGKMINKTKELGLSLGDRACLATALAANIKVYTTDQIWQKLKIPKLKIIIAR